MGDIINTGQHGDLLTRYAEMRDGDLVQLALFSGDLTPLAKGVAADELHARNLLPRLQRALRRDIDGRSKPEVDRIVATLQSRPCPICGRHDQYLNAGKVSDGVISPTLAFGVLEVQTVFYIGCTGCLKARAVRGLPPLKRDGRVKPTRAMADYAYACIGLLLEYSDVADVLDAIVSLDRMRILASVAAAEP